MGEETMAFFYFLEPVMMAVGFDSVTTVVLSYLDLKLDVWRPLNPFATVIASRIQQACRQQMTYCYVLSSGFVMVAMSTYFVIIYG